jgi:hypothetical protein
MTRNTLHGILVLLLVAGAGAAAGERTDIRGMGMARTFTASTHGLDAAGINPANLVTGHDGFMTLGLLPVGLHVGSDFLTYDLYEKYFTGVDTDSGRVGRYLQDGDKQDILSAFPSGLGTLAADVEVRPIGLLLNLGFGSIAFTMTEHVSSSLAIPQQYAQFLLYGNTPGSMYDFSQTHFAASWTREYGMSFGMRLPDIAFASNVTGGFGVKLVHGYAYAELDRFQTSLSTSTSGVLRGVLDLHARTSRIDALTEDGSDDFNPFPAPAGTGIGIDFGMAGDLTEFLRFGISVTDIGSMQWTRNVEEVIADSSIIVDDPLDGEQRDGVEDAVNGRSQDGEAFGTSLPTTLRIGVAIELHKVPFFKKFVYGEMTLACDYNQGFARTMRSTRNPRLSVGMEYRPWGFLPLRSGLSFGGTDHFNVALGFGLHLGPFELDLASENMNWLFSNGSLSYGSAAVGMRLNL